MVGASVMVRAQDWMGILGGRFSREPPLTTGT
jgi:hypothetical protein